MLFSSWQFRCTTIQFPATPLLCISMLVHCDSFQLIASAVLFYAYPLHLSSTLGLCFTLLIKSMPLRLVSRPVPTVLVLIRSARFHGSSIQCFSVPTHYISWPLQCTSFLFHRLSRLINAVTPHCVAFPFLRFSPLFVSMPLLNATLPSPSNAVT